MPKSLAAVLLVAVLVGLVGVVGFAEMKYVTVMHGWPGEQAPAFQKIVAAFEAENPDITVIVEIVGRDRPALLATRLAQGNPPDLNIPLGLSSYAASPRGS